MVEGRAPETSLLDRQQLGESRLIEHIPVGLVHQALQPALRVPRRFGIADESGIISHTRVRPRGLDPAKKPCLVLATGDDSLPEAPDRPSAPRPNEPRGQRILVVILIEDEDLAAATSATGSRRQRPIDAFDLSRDDHPGPGHPPGSLIEMSHLPKMSPQMRRSRIGTTPTSPLPSTTGMSVKFIERGRSAAPTAAQLSWLTRMSSPGVKRLSSSAARGRIESSDCGLARRCGDSQNLPFHRWRHRPADQGCDSSNLSACAGIPERVQEQARSRWVQCRLRFFDSYRTQKLFWLPNSGQDAESTQSAIRNGRGLERPGRIRAGNLLFDPDRLVRT